MNPKIKQLARQLIETSEYYSSLKGEYSEEVIFEKAMEEAEGILKGAWQPLNTNHIYPHEYSLSYWKKGKLLQILDWRRYWLGAI